MRKTRFGSAAENGLATFPATILLASRLDHAFSFSYGVRRDCNDELMACTEATSRWRLSAEASQNVRVDAKTSIATIWEFPTPTTRRSF
jgi:hypothetical protein